MAELKVKIGNIQLRNPLMVASGTFGYGEEMKNWVDLNRYGALITKSITLKERQGNPPPRIAETGSGMLNSIGLANVGIKHFIEEKLPFLQSLDTPVFVNIAGGTPGEYVELVTMLEDHPGIAGYEINLSCPNVKEGGIEFGRNAATCLNITADLRKLTHRCLMIKLTPNITFISEVGKAVEEAGADCISAINTLVGLGIDIRTRKPLLHTVTGGYSGAAIKPVALAKVYELYGSVSIPIIGIGGIMSWQDVIEFALAGATAVQIGTLNFINPENLNDLLPGIEQYCIEYDIRQFSMLTGAMQIHE